MEGTSWLCSVDQMSEALRRIKGDLGARALGLFDGDLADLHATSEESFDAFRAVFPTSPCWSFDHQEWFRQLESSPIQGARHECACSVRHTIDGYLSNDRWILMILVESPSALYASDSVTLDVFLQCLPPKTRTPRRGGKGPLHASIGIPVWWVRGG